MVTFCFGSDAVLSGGSSSGTSVRVDQTTRRHIPEARGLAVNDQQVTFQNDIAQRVSLKQVCSKTYFDERLQPFFMG